MIQRHNLCPCGSGKQYQDCCLPHLVLSQAEDKSAPRASAAPPVADTHPAPAAGGMPAAAALLEITCALFDQALARQQAGDLDAARALYRAILRQDPAHHGALHMLGLLEVQHGQVALGLDLLRQSLAVPVPHDIRQRAHPTMYCNLATVLAQQGENAAAIACYRQVLALCPEHAVAHAALGGLLVEAGEIEPAIAHLRQALAQSESYEAWYNLGLALSQQGHRAAALDCYRRAIALDARPFPAWINLGNLLREEGAFDAAIACYQQVLAFYPDLADAHNNLGVTRYRQGQPELAIPHFEAALARDPHHLGALVNLGVAHSDLGAIDAALACYQRAIALSPTAVDAHNNLGSLYQRLGRADEAVAAFRRVLALTPDNFDTYSNLLFSLSFHSEYTPARYLAEARAYGERVRAKARPFTTWPTPPLDHGPLRVGLISGDFGEHPVGYFLESILGALDPRRIELHAYVTRILDHPLTARIRPYFASWTSLCGLNDEAAARLVHSHGLHVLIDLVGHTAYNRLPMMAWKPAPVQVSWLGYFASTGVPGIDYFLADPVSVPLEAQDEFSETIWYLPETRLCFTPPTEEPVSPLPALSTGVVTFGCFQRLAKINSAVLACWARILAARPHTRLRIQTRLDGAVASFERALQEAGIPRARVELVERTFRTDYLAAHAAVDLILDTFPFPGGATTCEALWMGVPTLTVPGAGLLARQGASLLTCAGLTDWIARDQDDYVARALRWCDDLPGLARLRATLRDRLRRSPLFDAPRFAQHLTVALEKMARGERAARIPSGQETHLPAAGVEEPLAAALALQQAGHLDAAEAQYLRLLGTTPGVFPALYLLGVLKLQRGDLIRAEAMLRTALALNDGLPELHYNLGLVLAARGHTEEARHHHDLAARLRQAIAEHGA